MSNNNYSIVQFHIGRGGSFRKPGQESLVGLYDFQSVLSDDSGLWFEEEDENGNPLPDKDWKVLDEAGGRVLLQGREAIESLTGTLDYDGEYDTDICKYIDDCSDKELDILAKTIFDGDIRRTDLTDDDVMFIASESNLVESKLSGASYTFNADPNTAETSEDFIDIMLSIKKESLEEVWNPDDEEDEDWNTDLAKLDVEYCSKYYKNHEMLICLQEDIIK